MAIIVNNNPASIAAQRNLSVSTAQLGRSVERLSSGLRIARAADDAAGLGLSETLRAHIRSVNQAVRNASDGISLTQVADGAAATIGSLLARMRELASQSATATVGVSERSFIEREFVSLRAEIERIAQVTEFNGQFLTSTAAGGTINFALQIGFKSGGANTLTMGLDQLSLSALNMTAVNVSTATAAQSALANIDSAISAVANARGNYGAFQNRLEATISNLRVTSENLTAAESRVRDADIAYETAVFTRNQILVQAGISVLAQANTLPQQALALLQQ